MVLQFQPPPYIDRNKEIGDAWGAAIGGGLSSIGQSISDTQKYKRDQAMRDLQMHILQQEQDRKKAEDAQKGLQFRSEYGSDAPTAMTNQISGPMTGDQSMRSVLDPVSPASPGSAAPAGGMVAQFRAWQQSRRSQGGPVAPAVSAMPPASPDQSGMPQSSVGYNEVLPGLFDPQTERGLGWSGKTSPGSKGIEAAGKLFEAKKKLEGGDTYTPEQTLSLVPGEAGQRLVRAYGGKGVPKDAVHVAAAGGRTEATLGERSDQFTTRQWNDLTRKTNPTIAPRGSPLGLAGINNQRADRAIAVLTNPKATDQQLAAGVVDLAAIMHGGAPDELEVKNQMYGTVRSKWNSLITYVTSKPQEARQPEVQDKIRQMIMDVKAVDNKTISDNLDAAEEEYADTISKTPERWKRYRQRISGMTEFLPGTNVGSTDFGNGGGGGGVAAPLQMLKRNPRTGQTIGWNGSAWVPAGGRP